MNCPKCSSRSHRKNGFKDNRQRYLCKKCGYNYSTLYGKGKSKKIKAKAIQLYLEGMGFRAIGRTLNVSNVAVLKWTRIATETIRAQLQQEMPQQKHKIAVMELDEMWHYVAKKNKKRGFGWQSIVKILP